MKECIKCGAIVPDDGIFCPKCGARADGKRECPKCGKPVDETAIYCTYCGARTDGKAVCAACGEIVDGDFCPKCGLRVRTPKPHAGEDGVYAPEPTSRSMTVYCRVADILSPALMLVAALAAFICSFFVGVTVNLSGSAPELNMPISQEQTATYFLYDCFKDLKLVFTKIPPVILTQFILTTVFVAAAIIVSLTLLAIASVKFGKAVYRKKYVNLTAYAAWSMGAAIAAAMAIYLQFGLSIKMSESTESLYGEVVPNGATKLAAIFPTILIVAAIVIKKIACGRKFLSLGGLGKTVCGLAAAVLAIIALFIGAGSFLTTTHSVDGLTVTSKTSSGMYVYTNYLNYYLQQLAASSSGSAEAVAAAPKPDISCVLSYVSNLMLIVALSVTVALALTAAGKKKSGIGALIGAIVTLCAAIFHVASSSAVRKYLVKTYEETSSAGLSVTLSTAPSIVCMVLAVLTLAAAVTAVVFRFVKNRDCDCDNRRERDDYARDYRNYSDNRSDYYEA